jgi:hypothetical protein
MTRDVIFEEIAFVSITIGPLQYALSLAQIVFECTLICTPVRPIINSGAVHVVVVVFTDVAIPVSPRICTSTVTDIVFDITFINIAVRQFEMTIVRRCRCDEAADDDGQQDA